LVIDDESIVATILDYAFRPLGHETIGADGGQAGVELARTGHPDAIVLDLMMPSKSGLDVLEELRHDETTRELPIVVLTAVVLSEEHRRCMAAGANLVLTKPFDPQDVAVAVDGLLAG
jgi:two-component system phosphate regulon response regulator PhoB